MEDLDDRAMAGVASAMAAAGVPQVTTPGASMLAASLGGYRDEVALALGRSALSDNGHWIVRGTVTLNKQDVAWTTGLGFQW